MHHHHEGWALLEITISMALMGVAMAGVVLLQGQALSISQRALMDAQVLGLAVELLESQAMGLQAAGTETELSDRLKRHAPNHSLGLIATSQGQSVLVLAKDPHRPSSDVRWQLPLEL